MAAQRIDYLDNLRAVIMLLGIVVHSLMFLVPVGFYPWPIRNIHTSLVYTYFALMIHIFRVPLFYLLAGFFARMLYCRVSTLSFIKHRVLRIAVPFGICMALLTLYHVGELLTYYQLVSGKVTWHYVHFIFDFTGSLWFLYYLLWLYVIALLLSGLWHLGFNKLFPKTVIKEKWQRLIKLPGYPIALAIPTIILFYFTQHYYLYPPMSFLPHPIPLFYYYCFFAFGWLWYGSEEKINFPIGSSSCYLFFAFVFAFPVYFYLFIHHHQQPLDRLAGLFAQILYPLIAWLCCIGFIGLFRWGLYKPNKLLKYFADGSYWFYLIQIPIIVLLQGYYALLILPMFLKFIYVIVIATIVMTISYGLLVRRTWVGVLLNGKRKDRLFS